MVLRSVLFCLHLFITLYFCFSLLLSVVLDVLEIRKRPVATVATTAAVIAASSTTKEAVVQKRPVMLLKPSPRTRTPSPSNPQSPSKKQQSPVIEKQTQRLAKKVQKSVLVKATSRRNGRFAATIDYFSRFI